MRVCFLSPGAAFVEHATALESAGAEVVVADRPPEGRFDIAVACGWRAAGPSFAVDAARRALLVTRLEHRALAPARPERMAAVAALSLPLTLIATSRWLESALREQHPAASVAYAPVGHYGVALLPPQDEPSPLRIAGAPPAVLEAMTEPFAHAHGGLDVVVELGDPLVEDAAAPGPPASPLTPILAAFGSGGVYVGVPTEGRDELVEHRVNGLLVEPDDVGGTAHALDSLARDPELLGRLRSGAAHSAEAWPTWDDAGVVLLGVLEGVLAAPAPSFDAAGLMAEITAEAAKLSAYEGEQTAALHEWAERLETRERELRESRGGGLRGRLGGRGS